MGGFSNAGVFVLLALGLNIVVGLAGLLDLGYAAFFAIGAYAYAYGASPFSGLHLPFLLMLVVGALVAATFGVLLGAPTLRLRGDYLAIVTLGFGEIVPIVFLNAEQVHRGHERHRRHLQPGHPVRRVQRPQPVAVLRADGIALVTIVDDPHLPAPGFPDRASLDGDPRGRAGRGRERPQHRHDEAARVRPRARRRPVSPACSTPRS